MLSDLKIHRRSRKPTTEPMTIPAMAPPLRLELEEDWPLCTVVVNWRASTKWAMPLGLVAVRGGILSPSEAYVLSNDVVLQDVKLCCN